MTQDRPRLAREFIVLATDLCSYGDSGKPETTPDHEPYGKESGILKGKRKFTIFRHSIAMRLLEVGADLKFAQARFGHANIQSTAIYAELVTPAFHCSRYEVLEDES